jgi:hypothetical protein
MGRVSENRSERLDRCCKGTEEGVRCCFATPGGVLCCCFLDVEE